MLELILDGGLGTVRYSGKSQRDKLSKLVCFRERVTERGKCEKE